jgi:hypothetical protein
MVTTVLILDFVKNQTSLPPKFLPHLDIKETVGRIGRNNSGGISALL